MEEHLDINQALRVFDKIASHGVKAEDKYSLNDMTAWSDFDGYTVQLADDKVKLSIYFHNKHEFNYKNSHELETFIKKIQAIDESIS